MITAMSTPNSPAFFDGGFTTRPSRIATRVGDIEAPFGSPSPAAHTVEIRFDGPASELADLFALLTAVCHGGGQARVDGNLKFASGGA
jgi:hypothetical protein